MPLSENNGKLELTFGPNSRIAQAYVRGVNEIEEAFYQKSPPGTLMSILDAFPNMLDTEFGEKFSAFYNSEFFEQSVQITREQLSSELAAQHGDLTLLDLCKQTMTEQVGHYLEHRLLSTAKKLVDRCKTLTPEMYSNPIETEGENHSSAFDLSLQRMEKLTEIKNKYEKLMQAFEKVKGIIEGLPDATFIFQLPDGQAYTQNRQDFFLYR